MQCHLHLNSFAPSANLDPDHPNDGSSSHWPSTRKKGNLTSDRQAGCLTETLIIDGQRTNISNNNSHQDPIVWRARFGSLGHRDPINCSNQYRHEGYEVDSAL